MGTHYSVHGVRMGGRVKVAYTQYISNVICTGLWPSLVLILYITHIHLRETLGASSHPHPLLVL